MNKYTVVHYTENGRDIFQEWFDDLRDDKGQKAIDRVVVRLEHDNFGDNRYCRDGVWELKINVSAGYRVYYSMVGEVVILLLCAGSKRTQQRDIDKAVECLKEFKRRNKI